MNFKLMVEMKNREDILLTIIGNLQRKINLHELEYELSEGYITEDEFYKILEDDFDNYGIEIRLVKSDKEAKVYVDVIKDVMKHLPKINQDLSEQDVSEMVGLDFVQHSHDLDERIKKG